eukprot:m.207477 g.207477  ORF g.207477 m.207477 type:complete len:127 (+) comp13762_c0_seq25:2249-2629(+)
MDVCCDTTARNIITQFGGDQFDFVVSNPPYVPTADMNNLDESVRAFESKQALDGGKDGLDVARCILSCCAAPSIYHANLSIWMELSEHQPHHISRIIEQDFEEKFQMERIGPINMGWRFVHIRAKV